MLNKDKLLRAARLAAPAAAILALAGCSKLTVMNPHGDIAVQQVIAVLAGKKVVG